MTSNGIKQVKILGSGTSTGVPIPGCNCPTCLSKDSRNKRMRASLLLTTIQGQNILIDTTPDLRTQGLKFNIKRIDAAIITHPHADHIHGIDDLRPYSFFNGGQSIPVYASHKHAPELIKKFPYIFDQKNFFSPQKPIRGGGLPKLELEIIENMNINIFGVPFHFYQLPHGHGYSLSFSSCGFAYIIDCHDIPTPVLNQLQEAHLKLLIIDCVKRGPHPSHLSLEQARDYALQINALQTGLTHLGHDLEHNSLHNELSKDCNFSISPVWDGQVFTL